jgi:hypothetical protein
MRTKQLRVIVGADDAIDVAKNAVAAFMHPTATLHLFAGHLHGQQTYRYSGYLETTDIAHTLNRAISPLPKRNAEP